MRGALPAVIFVVAGLLLPPPAHAAGMEVKSGSYVGNGTDDRSIFVGFQPDVLFVKRDGAFFGVVRTSTIPGDATKSLDPAGVAFFVNGIQSLTATGFTVGTAAQVNAAAATYYWVAFKAAPGELKVGTYVGDGLDNRSITGVGFQPEYVITLPRVGGAAGTPLHRSSTMPGDTSYDFGVTEIGPPADAIQLFEPDGFQVGLSTAVNTLNATYHYIAWNAVAGSMAVGTYAGDGSDNRPLDIVGFMPEWVIVKHDGDLEPFTHKPASTGVATDLSLVFSGAAGIADAIQALRPLGFEVGTQLRANENLVTYHWIAFGPRTSTINYRSIGTAAAYGTGTISVTSGSTTVTGAGTAWRIANRGRGDVVTIPCPDPPTCTGGVHYTVASADTDAELQLTQGYAGATASGVSYLIRRQFSTLAAWEDCVDGPPGVACPFFPVTSASLVTDGRSEVGIAYKDSVFTAGATDVVTIDGSTTDALHTITLTVDPGNRHNGIAGNGVILDGGAATDSAVLVLDDFVTVEWLEIRGGGAGFDGVEWQSIAAVNKGVARNLLIHNLPDTGIQIQDSAAIVDIYDNILYRNGRGIRNVSALTTGTLRIFNNTVFGSTSTGGITASVVAPGLITLRNNIAHSNVGGGGDFNVPSPNAASSNNLASDTTGTTHSPGGGGLDSVPLANLRFVSTTPGAENLHIQRGSAAENNAADLSAVFTTDIDDELRRTPWDRGADDVRSVVNYRSIGTAGPYTTGTANATTGSTSVTGTGGTAWLANNRGRGDVLTLPCPDPPTCTGGTHYTILGVISDTQLILTTPFAGATGPYTYAIRRQFATLAAWETCIDGNPCGFFPVASASLVADDRSEVGIAYKETPLARVSISGSTTDALHTITLTADPGNRHLGIPGNGVVVDNGVASLAGVLVDDDHITVEWLEIKGGLDEGVEFQNLAPGSNKGMARNLLVHNTTKDGILVDDVDATVDVYNNIVYNTGGTGGISLGGSALTTGTIRVFNNTVYNNSAGGITAGGSNPSITLVNNVAHSNAAPGDFSVTGLNGSSRNNLASNLSGTTHSPAGGGLNSVPLASLLFVSTTPGSENLHIQAGSAAENNGADLRSVFNVDIDGGLRQLPWDRGADDIGATTAVTLSSFTAFPADTAVNLSWTTASELQNLGFHLYRAESSAGPYTRITSSLIAGLGSSPTGQSYSYRDGGLVNGRTYYYELEDVETTGRTERHGPVSATPAPSGCCTSPPPASGGDSGSLPGTAYGDPAAVVLREVERSARHVVLELLTGGFVATPAEGGRVRLSIPGFESGSGPGEPELPMRRALVEATAGREVRLSVLASDVLHFTGLRPVAEGEPGIEVTLDGSVVASSGAVSESPAFQGVFPRESAVLEGTVFQGETKKAELLLSPLRWDGNGLELSRRLLVRLDFTGTEGAETSLGGSRGRRAVVRASRGRRGLVAQLVVRERGLYRVDYEDVFPGRADAGIQASSLRLSRQAQAIAFHVEPDAARFGPGSALYFLSEGSFLNPYGDAVYELETGAHGALMAVERPAPASTPVSEHVQTLEREENHYYQAGLLDALDLWLWDLLISPVSKSYPFTVDHVSSLSPAHVSVWLQGASDFEGVIDHHVKVRVNGVPVGEGSWNGRLPQTLDLEIGPGTLQEGTNTLDLENMGDTGASYSMVFLSRFSLRYPRTLVAFQGKLEGSFTSSGQAEVGGLSATSFLLDTTDSPRWLRGALATPTSLSFPVEAGRSYLATSVVQRPDIRRIQASGLKSATNRADYLLLAPKAFLQAAQPLLDLRESQGLVTKAISLENVYEQFGHGETRPEAIKEFLEYAYHFWASPSPRYVLLLGDASYDPKDYLKTGVKDWLPGFPVKTSYLWTVSDPAYASVNGDDLVPDLAIGRLPAGSVEEAQRLVQKILLFENGGGSFAGQAVLVADNADLAGNFEQDADEIASTVLSGRNPRKIYYSQLGGSTRAEIEDAFDEGASFLSYLGHGGTVVWASENIFNYQDVQSLQPQPQQPLLLTMNCLNGFFHFPPLNSLSEELLKAEGKGVIGAFSPSGLSVNDAAHLFHKAVLEQILSGRHERLGDALLAAQEDYARSGAFPELLSIYHLLGDPALRMH